LIIPKGTKKTPTNSSNSEKNTPSYRPGRMVSITNLEEAIQDDQQDIDNREYEIQDL